MAKIPFDIKFRSQIESGEYKLVAGNEFPWPAKIVCWTYNGDNLIVIVTNPDGDETGLIYTPNGKHKAFAPKVDSDLFIITPEPELTEFESAIESYIKAYTGIIQTASAAKQWAKELLELAKKELLSYHDESNPQIEAMADLERAISCNGKIPLWLVERFKEEREKGKADALKDLPRWKKLTLGLNTSFLGYRNELELFYKDKVIALSELEKLPGFKEDEK